MASRARGRLRGGATGRGRGRGAPAAASHHHDAARKDSGFTTSLRRAADKAAASKHDSAASPMDDADVTLVYRRPPRQKAGPAAASRATSSTTRHVHFGSTTVHTIDDAEAAASSPVAVPTSGPSTSPWQFWQRCASRSHLTQALRECCFLVSDNETAAPGSVSTEDAVVWPSLSELDEQRLRVAVQALLDLRGLLMFPQSTPGTACEAEMSHLAAQSACWVAQAHVEAVVALAQLSEAAVPSCEPRLISHDALTLARASSVVAQWPEDSPQRGRTEGSRRSSLRVVPAPLCPTDVVRRLTQLTRLCRLRHRYATLLPCVAQCAETASVAHVLFSHSQEFVDRVRALAESELRAGRLTSSVSSLEARAAAALDADTFLLLPGVTSRHRREQAVLTGLLKLVNSRDCALDTSSWGPMSMLPPLKVTDGVYVISQLSRMHALERVLQEAEFYGLPTFLRSIRRPSTGAATQGHHLFGAGPWATPALSSAAVTGNRAESSLEMWLPTPLLPQAGNGQGRHVDASRWQRPPHQIFLCTDVLDGERFIMPGAMQAPVVQEELIELCLRHCCFGMLVGEADEILHLLKATTEYHMAMWQRRLQRAQSLATASALKAEALEDAEAGVSAVTDADASASVASPPLGQHHILRDPLGLYARRARAHARQLLLHGGGGEAAENASGHDSEPRCASVDWLCGNRWSVAAETRYYGLLYGVVVEEGNGLDTHTDESTQHDDGAGQTAEEAVDPAAPLDVDAVTPDTLRPAEAVTYYVAAVVELRR